MFLAIDTSLGTAVAVVEDDGVIAAQATSSDPRGHAEVIGTLIQRALAEASVDASAIDAVAAGMGPGPFTGLRVGIAAARTFALGRGIPVIPVASHDAVALELLLFDALAGGFQDAPDEPFAVVTDARRREFAYTVYRGLDADGLPVRVAEPALTPRDDLDGILETGSILRRDAEAIPAGMLGLVAARAVAAGRSVASSDALYLRSPDVTMPHGPKKVTPAAAAGAGAADGGTR
ncbi:tRNA (adenosine(37)-N6)-threonylcarbamoyltransferase complex dimerization subunit type 1 TsaB [Microbacterium sp. C7(2022)]|uniref:tRNA (adenosine(37)-N6)-threonylcarbamoyltransferase complex dimerization subunit type 1 TsaB n=1 Tax=Microbacterium sp. C7(2022) TaxID=2992759 RepID=UPI00237A52B3|nr:tRNA (adenosine(37)-N6)-threonylcarbamoyltransferase complex dimerization subunit type 1 TsaB [Microbacterium sp. C7(2022)]MDE0545430.1 tRNA (adenosine(37)-N6)-threonylcarbamoyltransferase complex dimerization subunit type 1 TsaB [Microbacterium sp. C7(2022)]